MLSHFIVIYKVSTEKLMPKKILAFDTSANSCSVAISEGQQILFYEEELRPSMQAERLMVMIENALNSTKLEYSDIGYLAVTIGPGSFTGIRIGLAVCNGILWSMKNLGIPIQPILIDNFEYSYYRLKMQVQEYDNAIIMLNAYRNQLYIKEFVKDKLNSTPKLMDVLDVVSMLKNSESRVICSGSGVGVIFEKIKNINNLTILPRFSNIKSIYLARLANEKISSKAWVPPVKVEPLYIRKPDAIIPNSKI